MTIQKKIMVSNIMGTMITALMIFIICVAYVHYNGRSLPNKNPDASGGRQ